MIFVNIFHLFTVKLFSISWPVRQAILSLLGPVDQTNEPIPGNLLINEDCMMRFILIGNGKAVNVKVTEGQDINCLRDIQVQIQIQIQKHSLKAILLNIIYIITTNNVHSLTFISEPYVICGYHTHTAWHSTCMLLVDSLQVCY